MYFVDLGESFPTVAKIGFDTAENEPAKIWYFENIFLQNIANFAIFASQRAAPRSRRRRRRLRAGDGAAEGDLQLPDGLDPGRQHRDEAPAGISWARRGHMLDTFCQTAW